MRKGLLITRGAIIEPTAKAPWSLVLPIEATVCEIAALMSSFGLYAVLEEGGHEVRLLPIGDRLPPTAENIAAVYQGRGDFPLGLFKWYGVDYAGT